MSDFFDEVEQDLKQENFYALIRKVLPYFVAVVVIIIATVSFYVFNQNRTIKIMENAGDKISLAEELLKEDKIKEAEDSLKNIIDTEDHNYGAVAAFKLASLLTKENKLEEAITIYKQISENKKINILLKDYASLLYLSHSYKKADSKKNIITELDKIIDEKTPFIVNAMELKASFLLDIGKIDQARIVLDALKVNNLTSDIQKNIKVLEWKSYEK